MPSNKHVRDSAKTQAHDTNSHVSRREFLKSAAVAGGGAALSGRSRVYSRQDNDAAKTQQIRDQSHRSRHHGESVIRSFSGMVARRQRSTSGPQLYRHIGEYILQRMRFPITRAADMPILTTLTPVAGCSTTMASAMDFSRRPLRRHFPHWLLHAIGPGISRASGSGLDNI